MIVEDDETIGSALQRLLVAAGYSVEHFVTGRDALNAANRRTPDLVILDVGLPDQDGFAVCRHLRSTFADLPVVMLTARDSDIDIVVGLDAGASDYVTKPFSAPVLLARLRAHLRGSTTDPDQPFECGALRIDPAARRVTLDETELDLRAKEFDLLLILARDAGRVVTRDRILAEVWDLHWESSTKTLDMHVSALRRKLGDDTDSRQWITTLRGVGYRFEAQ